MYTHRHTYTEFLTLFLVETTNKIVIVFYYNSRKCIHSDYIRNPGIFIICNITQYY